MSKVPLQRRIVTARRALIRVELAMEKVRAERVEAERALAELHGEFPIRETARRSPVGAVSVSNLFRGRLMMTPEHALMTLDAAEAARTEATP